VSRARARAREQRQREQAQRRAAQDRRRRRRERLARFRPRLPGRSRPARRSGPPRRRNPVWSVAVAAALGVQVVVWLLTGSWPVRLAFAAVTVIALPAVVTLAGGRR
jgi:Flp pilus assembly protein TadB